MVAESSENEVKDALEALNMLYGEDREVRIVHGDLQEEGVHQETSKVVKKLLNKDKLVQEWPRMKDILSGSYKSLSIPSVYKRVINMHQDLTEFAQLCMIALCFSVTSVECERSFSTQNRLKNKYRSSPNLGHSHLSYYEWS